VTLTVSPFLARPVGGDALLLLLLLLSTLGFVGFGKPPLESRPKTAARLDLEVAEGGEPVLSRPVGWDALPFPRAPILVNVEAWLVCSAPVP
jgi:hypothetical protein